MFSRIWTGQANCRQNNQLSDELQKVKAFVTEIGTDPDVHVKVLLKNKTKVKGYISEIKADSFSITREGSTNTEVIYSEVLKIGSKSRQTPRPQ